MAIRRKRDARDFNDPELQTACYEYRRLYWQYETEIVEANERGNILHPNHLLLVIAHRRRYRDLIDERRADGRWPETFGT